MNEIRRLQRRFEYDRWAQERTLESLSAASATGAESEALDRPVERFAHLLGTGHLWLARIRDERPPCAVWPAWTLDDCRRENPALIERLEAWSGSLDEEQLERRVDYVNTQGEAWSDTVRDIAEHVLLHGAYHRGQIASDLRAAGFAPAYTDFIQAVRTGELHPRA